MLGSSGIWYNITEDAAIDLRAAEAGAHKAKRISGPLAVKTSCIASAIGFLPVSTLTAWSRELMEGWQHPSVTAPNVGITIYDFEGQMRLHKESENLERVQLEKRVEFARLDAQAEYYESKRATDNALARVTEKSRVAQSAPADTAAPLAAPVAPESAGNTPKFKRAALIAAHIHEWPTIARDIADAKENGLAATAKAGERGWIESAAMGWAKANGKLEHTAKPASSLAQVMHNLRDLPGRKHTLEG